ncbi:uncharacterized protein DS421_13g435460 [Arachis hypogaea]|nr:uncharacterized protein DS421_13g435460 [Arachis hypogaea]
MACHIFVVLLLNVLMNQLFLNFLINYNKIDFFIIIIIRYVKSKTNKSGRVRNI